MKFLSLFILPILSQALSHPFTLCQQNSLLTVDTLTFTPDPPVSGLDLKIQIQGSTSKDITSADTTLTITAFGIKVLNENIDLCTLTQCPVLASQPVQLEIVQNIPNLIPANVEIDVELNSKSSTGEEIICIDTNFKVQPALLCNNLR